MGHLTNCIILLSATFNSTIFSSWLLSILILLNILLTLTATVVCFDSAAHVVNQEFIICGR